MAKVKFNVKTHDRDTGITYPVSDEFVDVPDAFVKRIKEFQGADPSRKDWFEFPKGRPAAPKKGDNSEEE